MIRHSEADGIVDDAGAPDALALEDEHPVIAAGELQRHLRCVVARSRSGERRLQVRDVAGLRVANRQRLGQHEPMR